MSVESLNAALDVARDKLIADTKLANDFAAAAKGAVDSMTALTALSKTAEYSVDKLNEAMQSSTGIGETFASTLNTLLDIQTAIGDGYQSRPDYQGNAGANDKAYATKIGDSFDKFISQAQTVGGAQNSAIAEILGKVLTELRGGIISPAEAIKVAQGLLGVFSSGLFQEIANPSTTTAMRNLDEELQRFLGGGSFS